MQNTELVFYQLCLLGGGPEINRSITVKEDFSWSVCYRRQLVNPEYCTILKDIPTRVNSGTLLRNL